MAIGNTPPYQPSPPQIAPQTEDGRNLATWVQQQLEQIANALSRQSRHQMQPLSAPPVTPREGLITYADGTNWNPLGFFEGTKQAAVVYKNGGWVQLDNGPMTISEFGFVQIGAVVSQRPQFSFINQFNDVFGTQIVGNKARTSGGLPANTNSGDVGLDLRGAGTFNGSFIQHSAMQFYQSGPVVAGVMPGRINLYTTKTAQFDHTFIFDESGNITLVGTIIAGLIQVATPSNANAATAGVPLDGLYTTTADPHIVYIRTA